MFSILDFSAKTIIISRIRSIFQVIKNENRDRYEVGINMYNPYCILIYGATNPCLKIRAGWRWQVDIIKESIASFRNDERSGTDGVE